MYIPPAFREDRIEVLHVAVRSHPLALLVTHGASGLTANLIPFTLVADRGDKGTLQAHLSKANPQLADLRLDAEVLVVFQGPQAYISPSWYSTKQEHGKVVPTWNYVIVQARGRPRVIDNADWLLDQIGVLTAQQEGLFEEPWSVNDAPHSFITNQLKGISGVEIPIDSIIGKWKASQNQPAANRAGVVAGLQRVDPASPMAEIVKRAKE
ncbi:MAG: FMN-binding negative transcriptional regulator [Phycisphaeraceae bacterium]|nr:FMN-binding negative transcriptional regulator [Phycisphaeraceae bacterium]